MDLDGTKIMVADDDRVVRRIVSVKLSGLGCEVSEAEDGQQALEQLGEEPLPDLLITDSLMPRVNGMQLVRNVRDSERLSKLPVIMLTARDEEVDRLVGLGVGADDYVVKPYSPREVVARVRAVLRRAGGPSAPPATLHVGPLSVDPASFEVRLEGRPLDVTVAEAEELLRADYYVYQHDDGSERVGCHGGYRLPEHVSKHVDLVWPTMHFGGPTLSRRASSSSGKITGGIRRPSGAPKAFAEVCMRCDSCIMPF